MKRIPAFAIAVGLACGATIGAAGHSLDSGSVRDAVGRLKPGATAILTPDALKPGAARDLLESHASPARLN